MDDSPGTASRVLVEGARVAGVRAFDLDLSNLHQRSRSAFTTLSLHPGEHYCLLAALVEHIQPSLVVEIGTFTGLSALAILSTLPTGARLISYDIVPWSTFPEHALRDADFDDGRLEQRIGNLADPGYFQQNRKVLQSASMVFVDGPKDGAFEPKFFRLLSGLPRAQSCWVVFDDIRLWKMLAFWRGISLPKLDATSVGHWSGTGLCLLTASPEQ